MILRHFTVFYGSLRQNLSHLHVYSGVPGVNRGDTPESGWIQPKSWHAVCLIFCRESMSISNRMLFLLHTVLAFHIFLKLLIISKVYLLLIWQ